MTEKKKATRPVAERKGGGNLVLFDLGGRGGDKGIIKKERFS